MNFFVAGDKHKHIGEVRLLSLVGLVRLVFVAALVGIVCKGPVS